MNFTLLTYLSTNHAGATGPLCRACLDRCLRHLQPREATGRQSLQQNEFYFHIGSGSWALGGRLALMGSPEGQK